MGFNFLSELFHDDFAIVLNIRDNIILVQQDKSHINKEKLIRLHKDGYGYRTEMRWTCK